MLPSLICPDGCPVLAVPIWLSCSSCPVLVVLFEERGTIYNDQKTQIPRILNISPTSLVVLSVYVKFHSQYSQYTVGTKTVVADAEF
jgi:hypothetical protein